MKNGLTGNKIPGQAYIAFRTIPIPVKTQSEGRNALTLNLVPISPGKSLLVIFDYRKSSLAAFEDYQRDGDLKKLQGKLNSPALIGASKFSDGLHEHLRIFLEDLPPEQKGNALLSIARFKRNGDKGCAFTECDNPEFWCQTTKIVGAKGEKEEIVVTFTDKDNCVAIDPPDPIQGHPEKVFVMRNQISLENRSDYF